MRTTPTGALAELPRRVALAACFAAASAVAHADPEPSAENPAPVVRAAGGENEGTEAPARPGEFRAAWVATVANIDWPSEPGLAVRRQKEELLDLLDDAQEVGLNALIFQVRPHADALYASELGALVAVLDRHHGRGAAAVLRPAEDGDRGGPRPRHRAARLAEPLPRRPPRLQGRVPR